METYNFMQNLPHAIRTERVSFPSAHPSGRTEVGFVAYRFDGIHETSERVFGMSRDGAIANLNECLTGKATP